MFILLKIINVIRFLLNIITVTLFISYFRMQDLLTADETIVFAGLILIMVPTFILFTIDFFIYNRGANSTRNHYLCALANSHYILFVIYFAVGFLFTSVSPSSEYDNNYSLILMTVMFCFLIIGSLTNIYQFFYVKKESITSK